MTSDDTRDDSYYEVQPDLSSWNEYLLLVKLSKGVGGRD